MEALEASKDCSSTSFGAGNLQPSVEARHAFTHAGDAIVRLAIADGLFKIKTDPVVCDSEKNFRPAV
jgi:hypothetical protein